jgi:two-component system NtrC family response regulator
MARVLIVEDEPNMRKVLSANLRQDGHVLVEAATVKEGLRAVNGNDFEVVLLDQKLPDGEGSEVFKAVQQSEPSTAVVMLTAYGTVELAVDAMRSGAFDFLTKPFSSDNLRAVVHRAAEWPHCSAKTICYAIPSAGLKGNRRSGGAVNPSQSCASSSRVWDLLKRRC